MKKSVKRIVSFVSAIAMLSTTAMAVSAAEVTSTVANTNSQVVTADTVAKSDADVFVITSATTEMEKAALEILKDQFNATAATKSAIKAAAAAMSEEELKAAVSSTTDAMKANADLNAAVDTAIKNINETVAAAKKANADAEIVISNVYNPFAGMASSALVDAAKEAAQVYVDQVNARIEAIANNDDSIKIAEIEAPVIDVDTKNIAASLDEAFEAQDEAKNEAIDSVEVEAEVAVKQYGDLNEDGEVKAVDLVIMLQANLGILTQDDFAKKGYNWVATDVDRDGEKAGLGDIMKLKKYLLEDINLEELGQLF